MATVPEARIPTGKEVLALTITNLQFYDATNKQGLCQEIDRLCDSDDTSYTRVAKTSRVNNSLEQVIGWLLNADGLWQFDDTNYTTLPIGTYTLVEAQQSYTFASDFLDILTVKVLDVNSNWVVVKPLDQQEDRSIALEEQFAATGLPIYYDKIGDSIKLYPAPTSTAVTLSSGLKVEFKRTASLFTVASDTSADTTEPGFASPYHVILAFMASIPQCMAYHKDRVLLYEKKVMDLKKELIEFYTKREKDTRHRISMAPISFR